MEHFFKKFQLTLSGASHWEKRMVQVHIFTRRSSFVEHSAIFCEYINSLGENNDFT